MWKRIFKERVRVRTLSFIAHLYNVFYDNVSMKRFLVRDDYYEEA